MFLLDKRKLLGKITDKWPAKVLSVAAALLLFVFYRVSMLETRYFSSIVQTETSADFIPTSSFNRLIKVSIRGDANKIYSIPEDDIETYINLDRYTQEGWNRIPVQVRKKGSALTVEPLEISVDPLVISLYLERKVSREIALIPALNGTVASGFELAGYELIPDVITVEGPRSVVESLSGLETGIIDLERRDRNFSVRVNIRTDIPLLDIKGDGVTEFHGAVRRQEIKDESEVQNAQ
jgi:YbbR domain-containing protein